MKHSSCAAGSFGLWLVVLLLGTPVAAQTPTKAPTSLSAKAQNGKEIYNDRCFICHDVDSNRVRRLGPPPLDGLFKKKTLINGKTVNEANVTEMLKIGPTPGMPGFRYMLTEQEIGDLVEFLKTK